MHVNSHCDSNYYISNQPQKRIAFSKTLKGRYFDIMGHFFSIYCIYKIFIVSQCKMMHRTVVAKQIFPSPSLSRPPFLPHSLPHSLTLSLSPSLPLSLPLSLSPSSLPLSLPPSLTQSLPLSLPLSLTPSRALNSSPPPLLQSIINIIFDRVGKIGMCLSSHSKLK